MQTKIVQSFENAGALGEVSRPIEGAMPDNQLLTDVRRFQLVQTPEPAGEVEISAKLVASDGHILAARVFSAKEPAQSKDDPAEAARALNAAFGNVVASLISWTRETIAAPAGKESAQAKEHGDSEKADNKERKRPARQR